MRNNTEWQAWEKQREEWQKRKHKADIRRRIIGVAIAVTLAGGLVALGAAIGRGN